MPGPLPSPMPSFGVLRETQCPRCGRDVDLPFGQLCRDCMATVRARARRVARRTALVSVGLFGGWTLWQLPPDRTVRMVAGGAALAIWLIMYTIAFRAAREWYASRP